MLCICNSGLGMLSTSYSIPPPVWPDADDGTGSGGSELASALLHTLGRPPPPEEPPQPPEEVPYVHVSTAVVYLTSFLCAYSMFSVMLPFVPAADPRATAPGMLEEGAKGRRVFGVVAVTYLSAVRAAHPPISARARSLRSAAAAEATPCPPHPPPITPLTLFPRLPLMLTL